MSYYFETFMFRRLSAARTSANHPGVARHLRAGMLGLMCLGLSWAAQAAPITWSAPTTVAADTDVSTSGRLVYAYDLANKAQTINTVPFAAGNSKTALGTDVTLSGFSGNSATAFGTGASGTAYYKLSSAYKNIIMGAAYGSTATATVTLNNLTIGRSYQVQVWVNDSRVASPARTETVSSSGGNTVTLNYSTTPATAGGVGQYTVGTFTADATSQAFTLTGNSSSQFNALQVRWLPPSGPATNGTWSAVGSGLNWSTPANWTNGVIPSGPTAVADFSTLDLSGDTTVHLDMPVTVGNLLFGDTDTSSLGSWVLDNSGNAVNVLTLDGPAPVISVNALGSGKSLAIPGVIAGDWGLVKAGTGMLELSGANVYAGGTTISNGVLRISTIADSGASALSTNGTLTFSGGALQFSGTDGATARPLAFPGAGTIDVPGGATLSLNPSNLTASASVAAWTGNGGITKAGLGTLNVGINGSPSGNSDRFTVSAATGGTFTMNEGTLNLMPKQYFTLPDNSGGSGTFIQNGGTVNFLPAITSDLYLGNSNAKEAYLTINNGLFDMSTNAVRAGTSSTATSALTLGNGIGSTATLKARAVYRSSGTSYLYLNGGTLKATADSTGFLYGLTAAYVSAGGAFIDDSGFGITIAQSLSDDYNLPGGSLTKLGAGTVILSGDSTYAGPTTNSAGTLQIGSGGTSGSLSSSTLVNQGTLAFNRSDAFSFPVPISGPGSVVQNGSGTLTLSGANTYTGVTTVSNGTLLVTTSSGVHGACAVRDGKTLGVTVAASGASLVVSNLAFGMASHLAFDLNFMGNPTAPILRSSGSLALNGGVIVDVLNGDYSVTGPSTNVLFRYAGTANGTGMFVGGTLPAVGGGLVATIVDDSAHQQVLLVIDMPVTHLNLTWNAGSAAWENSSLNWLEASSGVLTNFNPGDFTLFDDTPAGTGPYTVTLASNVMPGGVTFNNSTKDYVLSGNGSISGYIGLLKDGAGNLTVVNDNSYFVGTTINAGIVQVGSGGASGSLGLGPITNNATLVFARSDTNTQSAVISGIGSLTNDGPGMLVLSAANSYSGGTTVNQGTVETANPAGLGSGAVTVNAGATLNLTGGALTYSGISTALSGGGTVNVTLGSGAGSTTMNGDNSGFNGTLNIGVGAVPGAGKVELDQPLGSGATVNLLTNSSLYVYGAAYHSTNYGSLFLYGGDTGESYGQLRLDSGACWAGPVTLAGDMTGAGDGTVGCYSGTGTISGNIGETGGSHSLIKVGNGTIVLSGNNTYSGDTVLKAGSLLMSGNNTYAGATLVNAGTLTIQGSNTYTGTTIVSSGALLNIQNGAALGNSAGGTIVSNSARLELQGDITVSNEWLSLAGTGGASFYDGALNSKSGTNLWAGNVTIAAANTRIGAESNSTLEVSGIIDSAGLTNGLTLRPYDLSSSVILSGSNTYLGDTTVVGGFVKLGGGDNRLPSGTVLNVGLSTVSGYFDLNGWNQEVAGLTVAQTSGTDRNLITNSAATASTLLVNAPAGTSSTYSGKLAGNLGLTKSGSGRLTLAGANTYSGPTVVSNGVLVLRTSPGTNNVAVWAGATLSATGLISGPVAVSAGATLAPGLTTSLNELLTISNTLELVGTTVIQVGKSGLSSLSDGITGVTDITYGGTLIVTNADNSTLAPGDVFTLFAVSGAKAGNFANVLVLPAEQGLSGSFDPQSGKLTLAALPVGLPPAITAITPAAGRTNGGTLVTITGSNFLSGLTIQFDGLSAPTAYLSDTQLTALTPAHAPGAVPVVVANTNGLSATNQFVYVLPPPPATLSSVTKAGVNLSLVWTGGTNQSCLLFSATNVTLPPMSWEVVATNVVGMNGLSTNTILINPSEPKRFYRLSIPYN